jgi:hypothetical protein
MVLISLGVTGISILILALAAVGILIAVIYTDSQVHSVSENVIEKKLSEVNVLASRATLRLADAEPGSVNPM